MSTLKKKYEYGVKQDTALCSGIKTDKCKKCYDNPDNRESSGVDQNWKASKNCSLAKQLDGGKKDDLQ